MLMKQGMNSLARFEVVIHGVAEPSLNTPLTHEAKTPNASRSEHHTCTGQTCCDCQTLWTCSLGGAGELHVSELCFIFAVIRSV